MQRILFEQIDVPWETVHKSDSGVFLHDIPDRWEPFQVEIRGVPEGKSDPQMIRLAVWFRDKEGV